MKCWVVTELELDSLSRSGTSAILAFSIGSGVLGFAADLLIELLVNDYKADIPTMIMSFVVALAFYGWGIKMWRDRRTVVDDIREGGVSAATGPGMAERQSRPPRYHLSSPSWATTPRGR